MVLAAAALLAPAAATDEAPAATTAAAAERLPPALSHGPVATTAPQTPTATTIILEWVQALLPDPTLSELLDAVLADETPTGLLPLLRLLPAADLYLQDEVDIALLPTLTRVWCRKGRRGQRYVETPGQNAKQYGFGLVDWRDGWCDWALAPRRRAEPFCDQLRRAVARSHQRGRKALVLCDNLGIHTPAGSKRLRALQEELGDALVLVYTPRYDPDSNRIEWLWRALRRAVTHGHQRQTLPPLLDDATSWATALSPADVLSQIGSPFAPAPVSLPTRLSHRRARRPSRFVRPPAPPALAHAA